MRDAEVIVVGGSLGGSAAARHLAARGHDVLVLERDRLPREKVCGEGLMPYGVRELVRLGVRDQLASAIDARPFVGIGYTAGGVRAGGRFPAGHRGLGVRRGRLDAALSDLLGDGVERREGTQVIGVSGQPGAMQVRTRSGVLRCRAVIAADGMRSSMRTALGLDRPRRGRPRYGLRGHVRLPEGRPQLSTVEVLVGEQRELYLTPVGERELNVAVLLEKPATRAMKGGLGPAFSSILRGPELEGLGEAEWITEPRLTGPLRNEARDVVTDGAMLVGDAAGFLDGITGEGMSLTLLSARLAAETLSTALRTGRLTARDLRPYAVRRRRLSRQLTLLTEIVLGGIRHRRLATRVVRGLARDPDLFDRVLAVNAGVGRVSDLGVAGLLQVLR